MNNSAVVDPAAGGLVVLFGGLVVLFRTLILGIAGPDSQRPILGNLTWLDLGSVLCILVLALLISIVLATVVRRRARVAKGEGVAGAPRHHAATAIIKPAQFLLWGCALYLVIGALLPRVAPAGAKRIFQDLVDEIARVRQLGASVLASAGVVGIIAGIAAQKTIGNLFAGFQIAMAQPMRQDDVVVVEGEWGRIEEITLTYLIVHIWDDRRLVVPLSYFIEKPFANWTRTSSQILGQVTLWVDYAFPVEEARAALKEIIEGSQRWDRRFWNLQVVDSSEKSMQLRILATSADSSTSWDLRCEIREKFIARIQSQWPQTLPQLRFQGGSPDLAKQNHG